MDLWQRARGFAEEAAKRSQELVAETAKMSKELAAETAKKSKEIAAQATQKADLLRSEALRAADQIKTTFAVDVPLIPPAISSALAAQGPNAAAGAATPTDPGSNLETFGVTEELREFVMGITLSTFRDFPMPDEPEISEVPTVSNVRQDLNEWQAKHATLVLLNVKEISKFRYELCPRYMKERKFWRIYFILVDSFVAPYERKYLELKKEGQQRQIDTVKEHPADAGVTVSDGKERKLQTKASTSSNAEFDLDVFLLGDLGSDDEGPDNGADGFDDDFDKIEHTPGLVSDDDDDDDDIKI